MSKQSIKTLFAEADRDKLAPILEALKAKGIRVSGEESGKADALLTAFGEHFYADEALKKALLDAVARNENILLLQLDEARTPDQLKNPVYARNIIAVGDRPAEHVADRIIDALPAKKSRSPLVFIAGGVALLALVAILTVQNMKVKEAPTEEPGATAEVQEIPYPLPGGLTEADLAEIRCVVIMGEHFKYYTNANRVCAPHGGTRWRDMLYELGTESEEEGSGNWRWYWNEDGQEISRTPYDLRFLSLIPNLEELHLAEVEVTDAPDLSEQIRLGRICARECDLGDLSWIAGSKVPEVDLRGDADFSPLGSLETLKTATLTLTGGGGLDLSYFSPQKLIDLKLDGGNNINYADLSGLAKCSYLKTVIIDNVPIRDLSFLSGKSTVEILDIHNLQPLEDISAVGTLKGLKSLAITECRNVRDYSAIAECVYLTQIELNPGEPQNLQDVSFLGGLTRLNEIHLGGVSLPDLGFLTDLSENVSHINDFRFEGSAGDYSGLAAFKKIALVALDLENTASASQIAPYLEGMSIVDLELRQIRDMDLSAVPQPMGSLLIDNCDLTDLSSIPEDFITKKLTLQNCSFLRSLEGLERQSSLGNGGGELFIYNCFRLTDWDALEGMELDKLEITGGYTLPSMETIRLSNLCLDSVAGIEDLNFLDELDNTETCSFKLVGLEEVNNLKPLERFHGRYISVSPELAEQGQDLVNGGFFKECRIEYPDHGWENDRSGIYLLSLDELETLPAALLRRVKNLYLAGDTLIDPTRYDVWANADPGSGEVRVERREFSADESEEVEHGKGDVTDLSRFEALTGLRDLRLFDQPLENLDGIQNFGELEILEIVGSPDLTDISPALTLQNLFELDFSGCPVESIQGIQNLPQLRGLIIQNTNVTDLSPLKECGFDSDNGQEEGFRLSLGDLPIEDYSPLSAVPAYEEIQINDIDAARFLPFLEGAKVYGFMAPNCLREDSESEDINALFADFVRVHPELRRLHVQWNQGITDLTPVLELENLEELRVSDAMDEALESLEGEEVHFRVDIESNG